MLYELEIVQGAGLFLPWKY